MCRRTLAWVAGLSIAHVSATNLAWAQPGSVLGFQKISDTQGGFTGILDDEDWSHGGGWSRPRTADRLTRWHHPAAPVY